MKKYLTIIKIEFQRQLTYRIDYFGFRIANLLKVLSLLIIWTIIFQKQAVVGGYTYEEMVTYILISWLFIYLTASYGFEDNISRDIHQGTLSNFLLKPIAYMRYMTILSISRISIALFSGILMMGMLMMIFHDSMLAPSSFLNLFIIVLMIFVGYFVRLCFSFLTGFISFWTVEVAGLQYTINVLIGFLAGTYFPMSMLPVVFYKLCLFFPFVYFIFLPTELYLGKISTMQGLLALGVELVWLGALYWLLKIVWQRGLKKYEAIGA